LSKRASLGPVFSKKDLKTNGNRPENIVKGTAKISFCKPVTKDFKNSFRKSLILRRKRSARDDFLKKVVEKWEYKEFHATAIKGTV
jgi:hypothetical protein